MLTELAELAFAPGSSRLLAVACACWLDRPGRLALRADSIDLGAWPCVLARSTWAPGHACWLDRPGRLALHAASKSVALCSKTRRVAPFGCPVRSWAPWMARFGCPVRSWAPWLARFDCPARSGWVDLAALRSPGRPGCQRKPQRLAYRRTASRTQERSIQDRCFMPQI